MKSDKRFPSVSSNNPSSLFFYPREIADSSRLLSMVLSMDGRWKIPEDRVEDYEKIGPIFYGRVWDDIERERERGNWWCRGLKIGVMDDRDFKINLAFHEYCSILNETLSLSLVFSFCFSVPQRSIETFDLPSIYGKIPEEIEWKIMRRSYDVL